MPASAGIRKWAFVLNILSIVAMVVLAVSVGMGILFADLPADLRISAGLAPETDPTRGLRLAIGLLGAFPVVAILYVLAQMSGLFQRYSQGETLTLACAAHIQRIGAGVIASAAFEVLVRPAQIALASLANPPGSRVLALSLESADFGLVLTGGLLLTIGWVMADAARIAQENREFV